MLNVHLERVGIKDWSGNHFLVLIRLVKDRCPPPAKAVRVFRAAGGAGSVLRRHAGRGSQVTAVFRVPVL